MSSIFNQAVLLDIGELLHRRRNGLYIPGQQILHNRAIPLSATSPAMRTAPAPTNTRATNTATTDNTNTNTTPQTTSAKPTRTQSTKTPPTSTEPTKTGGQKRRKTDSKPAGGSQKKHKTANKENTFTPPGTHDTKAQSRKRSLETVLGAPTATQRRSDRLALRPHIN